jgi:tetratricopeptide (TPR) repeat protein
MKKSKKDKTIKSAAPTVKVLRQEKPAGVTLSTIMLFTLIIGSFAASSFIRNAVYHDFLTLWGNITKTSPNKRRAHENYGQALSTVGRLDEALREFNTVLSLRDDGSVPLRDLYREIGVVYFRMGRIEDAISSWQTGLRHAPYDTSLLNNLSIALMQTGRYDEAATAAESALYSESNMPQALNTMGQVLMIKREYEKALSYFMRALELQPDVAARYWNVALAMDQAGKSKQAAEYVKKYLEVEPDPAARQRALSFQEYLRTKAGR